VILNEMLGIQDMKKEFFVGKELWWLELHDQSED
jgi:hypothetical protein